MNKEGIIKRKYNEKVLLFVVLDRVVLLLIQLLFLIVIFVMNGGYKIHTDSVDIG